jgi:hypothetical protein
MCVDCHYTPCILFFVPPLNKVFPVCVSVCVFMYSHVVINFQNTLHFSSCSSLSLTSTPTHPTHISVQHSHYELS